MTRNNKSLMAELENDVLTEQPIAKTLRKLILFGAQAGSPELREWASNELRGYQLDSDVPDYRKVAAVIQMDGATHNVLVKRQRVGVTELPDFVQNDIDEVYVFSGPIAEIEALSRPASPKDTVVNLSLPMARELGRIMAQKSHGAIHIDSIYWAVSRVSIAQVVDQVRTRLAELLAELRAVTPAGQSVPTPPQAQHAVNIVLNGIGTRATLNMISAGEGSTNRIDAQPDSQTNFWTLGRRVAAGVAGAAALAASVIAIVQFVRP
jgi:hypothetical protein